MNYFDTLKDNNVKALFKVLALEKYGRDGKSWEQVCDTLTFEQRWAIFAIVHDCMKAIGLPNWEKPMLLNREEPLCQEADA